MYFGPAPFQRTLISKIGEYVHLLQETILYRTDGAQCFAKLRIANGYYQLLLVHRVTNQPVLRLRIQSRRLYSNPCDIKDPTVYETNTAEWLRTSVEADVDDKLQIVLCSQVLEIKTFYEHKSALVCADLTGCHHLHFSIDGRNEDNIGVDDNDVDPHERHDYHYLYDVTITKYPVDQSNPWLKRARKWCNIIRFYDKRDLREEGFDAKFLQARLVDYNRVTDSFRNNVTPRG